jgi:uncharacterized protein (TIGR02246 family)
MRLHSLLLVGLVIVAAPACQPGGTSATPSADITVDEAKAAINRTRNEYVAAWRAANADRIANLYTNDALVLYPNQAAIAGRAAILVYFKSFFAEFTQELFELTSAEIEVFGPWAFDRGTVRWRGVPRAGGDPVEDHGKYLVILQRQPDGSWKVARDMDNSDRPLTQSTRSAN